MRAKFYVLLCDSSVYACFVVNEESDVNSHLTYKQSTKVLPSDSSRNFYITIYGLTVFLNELNCCKTYRHSVTQFIRSSKSPYVIRLQSSQREFLDKTW